MFPPKSPQAHPLETPLELGDPNCPSSRKLQTGVHSTTLAPLRAVLGQHLSKLGEWGVRIAQPHRSPVEAIGVIEVSRTVELHHNIGPTNVGVNTFSTMATRGARVQKDARRAPGALTFPHYPLQPPNDPTACRHLLSYNHLPICTFSLLLCCSVLCVLLLGHRETRSLLLNEQFEAGGRCECTAHCL